MPANPAMGHGRPRKRRDAAQATSPETIARKERAARIFEYRKQGATLAQIGEWEKIATSRVHAIITETLDGMVFDSVDAVRKLELARLDDLLFGHFQRAAGGDGWSTDRVLAIMERRAKLVGLDAPIRTEETGALADAKASLLQKLDGMAGRLTASSPPRIGADGTGPVVEVEAQPLPEGDGEG